MGRKALPKKRSPDAEIFRQLRNVLRLLGHPRRLTENPLAKSVWKASGVAWEGATENELTHSLVTTLRALLVGASQRQRVIVERCDFDGEPHAEVIRRLHISRRHFYRERSAALTMLALSLGEKHTPREVQVVQLSPDALGLQMTLARGLEQNGHWATAAEVLEQLCAETADPTIRLTIESRLVRLYTVVGRYTLAEEHLCRAFDLANGESSVPSWARAETAVGAARLLIATGKVADGRRAARRSRAELRSHALGPGDCGAAAALLSAVNLCTELAIGRWNPSDANALAAEACDALREFRIDSIAAVVETRFLHAASRFIAGDMHEGRQAEDDLSSCYRLALENSQTRDAINCAALLASRMRRTSRGAQAVDLLRPLRDVARSVMVGDDLAGFYLELASAALDIGAISLALECQEDLHERVALSPLMQPPSQVLSARLAFAAGRFEVALKTAEAAETGLVCIGREGWKGGALQLQAESLASLGEKARAIRTLRLALDHYQAMNQIRRLAAGYLSMGLLTGDPAFRAKAFSLSARLDE